MSYQNDPAVRQRIDRLLRINASLRANLGTKTATDLGTESAADQVWMKLLEEIHQLDPEYYQSIASNEEKDMLAKKIYSKVQYRAQEGWYYIEVLYL